MTKHDCDLDSPTRAYGEAIGYCYEDEDGTFWSGNGEYSSQVNFCPVCGVKAPVQIDPDWKEKT